MQARCTNIPIVYWARIQKVCTPGHLHYFTVTVLLVLTEFVPSSPNAARILWSLPGLWNSFDRERSLCSLPPGNWCTGWQEKGLSTGTLYNWQSCRMCGRREDMKGSREMVSGESGHTTYNVSAVRCSFRGTEWCQTVPRHWLKGETCAGSFREGV